MDPFASHMIGQTRMKELREEATRHRLAAHARRERTNRFRAAAGNWLIRMGQRVTPSAPIRPLELHR